MSSFTAELVTKHLDNELRELVEPFEYYLGDLILWQERVVVPVGFVTDGASIPPFLWPVFGHPFEDFGKSGVLHDFLYRSPLIEHHYGDGRIELVRVSRSRADSIFRESAKVLNLPAWKRAGAWAGVRLFGWWVWRKYRKADPPKA